MGFLPLGGGSGIGAAIVVGNNAGDFQTTSNNYVSERVTVAAKTGDHLLCLLTTARLTVINFL